jgi:hypothetical protein
MMVWEMMDDGLIKMTNDQFNAEYGMRNGRPSQAKLSRIACCVVQRGRCGLNWLEKQWGEGENGCPLLRI